MSISALNSALLELLAIHPSLASEDYVNNKQQFHLYHLLTEQRHPKTQNLSRLIAENTAAGLRALLSVDEDIAQQLNVIVHNPETLKQLNCASASIQQALLGGQRIYYYGTGSTGRLAATLESGLWRPFWQKLEKLAFWPKLEKRLPHIKNRVKGEITGADRTLISSLEGFEDSQLIGQLQLQENHISEDDVVIAMTEGGETSAVIGCILAAAEQHKTHTCEHLFFVYNNPDEVLLPFDRSRMVLEHPKINKINLATGPQAISGSTRMQATTIGLYVMGAVLQDAVYRVLQTCLTADELASSGFDESFTLKSQLLQFTQIQKTLYQLADKLAPWVEKEANTYQKFGHSYYFAGRGLLCVFVDVTERSPTFRLPPLDKKSTEKKSWIEIWSPAKSQSEAWDMLLRRQFKGLDAGFYKKLFSELADRYLREVALHSLDDAGDEQQFHYDLSAQEQRLRHLFPSPNDLGVMFLFGDEEITPIFQQWLNKFSFTKTPVIIFSLAAPESDFSGDNLMHIHLNISKRDPFDLYLTIALKMVLNAVSSATMAKIGRIVGNTMTNVQPSNLKLIGRATYLIQQHVNNVLQNAKWPKHSNISAITFAEANAVLFSAKDFLEQQGSATESAEVAVSIIRILEALKKSENISWEQAILVLKAQGLENYLNAFMLVSSEYAKFKPK